MHKYIAHILYCALMLVAPSGAVTNMVISSDRVDFYGGYWPADGSNVAHTATAGRLEVTATGIIVNTNAFYIDGVPYPDTITSPYGDELLVDGDMGSSAGWTTIDAGASISGGTLTMTSDGVNYIDVIQDGIFSSTTEYILIYDILTNTLSTGNNTIVRGNDIGISSIVIPAGVTGLRTNQFTTGTVSNGRYWLFVRPTEPSGHLIVIDSISIREVL